MGGAGTSIAIEHYVKLRYSLSRGNIRVVQEPLSFELLTSIKLTTLLSSVYSISL